MSLHISVVSIEGDHLHDVDKLLIQCDYAIEEERIVHSGKEASAGLNWRPGRNQVAKVAYLHNGWTHIVDPELVLMMDDVWLDCSRQWNNRVLAWVCEGASGSYGLTLFDAGVKRREVMSVDGEILVADGDSIQEEKELNWQDAFEDDVLNIAQNLGAEYDYLEPDREYMIYRLNET